MTRSLKYSGGFGGASVSITTRRSASGRTEALIDISLTVSPIRNADGRVIGASKIARDITDRKRSQAEQELLLREMSHRIKNLFAVTNGLVGLSARAARTPAEMAESLRARLGALSRAQGLTRIGLIENAELDRETTLHALIKTIFAPYLETQQGERLVVRGCDVSIRSNAITSSCPRSARVRDERRQAWFSFVTRGARRHRLLGGDEHIEAAMAGAGWTAD